MVNVTQKEQQAIGDIYQIYLQANNAIKMADSNNKYQDSYRKEKSNFSRVRKQAIQAIQTALQTNNANGALAIAAGYRNKTSRPLYNSQVFPEHARILEKDLQQKIQNMPHAQRSDIPLQKISHKFLESQLLDTVESLLKSRAERLKQLRTQQRYRPNWWRRVWHGIRHGHMNYAKWLENNIRSLQTSQRDLTNLSNAIFHSRNPLAQMLKTAKNALGDIKYYEKKEGLASTKDIRRTIKSIQDIEKKHEQRGVRP